ncbi:hypothetical protein FRC17_005631 [Serendipita sp. 399]|nr:hypothetical protein FRC17_005631 [Serendipita sp. 399]
MVNVLILGATGPTGLALIEEAVVRNHTVIVFARSPQKLPEKYTQNPSIFVVKGSLENESDIRWAFQVQAPGRTESENENKKFDFLKIDVIVSALGPPVKKIHPSGHPIAKGYENVIKVAKEFEVKRFIVLGTPSITDEHDKFDARFKALIIGVEIFAPHAYEDIVEIGKVFEKEAQLDWTIARIPVLVEHEDGKYGAGYIGDGTASPVLTRSLFAKFVFDEADASSWIRKRPLVSWVN